MKKTQIAIIVPFTREGKILLQKRTQNAQNFPGLWSFFGGHIEEGETPDQAVQRETREEIGLHLPALPLFRKYETATHDLYTYFYEIELSEDVLRQQQKEGEDLGFFSPEESSSLDFIPDLRPILDDVGREIQNIVSV